jgi:hypothetical protein
MKKIKALDVVNIYRAFNDVSLYGVPMEDAKAFMRFRREARPVALGWDEQVKEALEKLKGETITEEELNKHLNEVLGEEAMREVEITPFAFSNDGEDMIIPQMRVVGGQWEAMKEALKPEKEE